MIDWAMAAGLALALIAVLLLALTLRRESAARVAAIGALEARQDAAEARAGRLAMLDRRLAAIAPLDALWLGWTRGARPERAMIACALTALAEARLVFPESFAGALDEASTLLLAYERHQTALEAALDGGRRYEREEMFERELALEQALKPTLESLRVQLAGAARIAD